MTPTCMSLLLGHLSHCAVSVQVLEAEMQSTGCQDMLAEWKDDPHIYEYPQIML